MKDKKLSDAIDYVCSCCPRISDCDERWEIPLSPLTTALMQSTVSAAWYVLWRTTTTPLMVTGTPAVVSTRRF